MPDAATGYLEGTGGVRVCYRAWEAAEPAGSVLCVHGLGEHSGRYRCLADALAPLDLSLYAIDMRGHGQSQGRRGHVREFESLLRDLDRLRHRAGRGVADRPIFLVGHSLGGLVAGRYAQEFAPDGLRGIVFVAPFVDVAMEVPGWKRRIGAAADRTIPTLSMDNGLEPAELFRREADRNDYVGDPLVHRRISARLWGEMQRASGRLVRDAPRLRDPVLLQLAGHDTVVSNEASRRFAERLGSRPEIIEYDGAYHALFYDPLAPAVFGDLVRWLRGRLAGANTDATPEVASVAGPDPTAGRTESTVEDR